MSVASSVDDWYEINLNPAYRFEDGEYNWLDNIVFRIGVQHVTNELPPIAEESDGYLGGFYSNRGRLIYGSISKDFC